jgi:predicted TIM-barrel fold metal-dependent hydrolase
MSRAEAHRRERQAPDGTARGAAPPPERDAIIDAHHHLWDLQAVRYPWLVDPPVPAHFGPYEKIRQDYRVEQFLRDIYSDYDTLVDAYRTITVAFTSGERRALFHDNAQRFYRL